MGIRFLCPNGHKLNVKADLAGKRGSCPECGAKLVIPTASTLPQAPPPSAAVAAAPPPPKPAPAVAEPEPAPTVSEPQPEPAATETVGADAIVTDPAALAASTYVSQRRRKKKTQLTLALVMLVAVLVLAGLLVWVLVTNSGTATPTPSDRADLSADFPASLLHESETT
jgi:hypothetical protein